MKLPVRPLNHFLKHALRCAFVGIVSSVSLLANAAPSVSGVSGTVGHGQLVTISGSGFGTRGSYNNVSDTWQSSKFLNFRFKDFEDGQLNSHGFYAQRGGSNWSAASSELGALSGGPRNSTRFMRRTFSTYESGGISANVSGAGNQLYSTFKFMMPANTQSGKFFRFYADAPQSNVYLSTGCQSRNVRGYSECTAGTCNPETEWGSGPNFNESQWHRVEIWADGSTNTFTVAVDGVTSWTKNNWLATSLALNGHSVDFPNMIDGPERGCGTGGSYNYDDIYVDFSRARVEIGDASTWSAVRKKEIQLPVAWADGSVQIRVNSGEFAAGQNLYLYVVTAGGVANSNGLPVKIGAAGNTVAPMPPTSVSVE